jgi:hypothetical protein
MKSVKRLNTVSTQPPEARDDAEQDAQHRGQRHANDADGKRGAHAVDHRREEVVPIGVGAQQVRAAGESIGVGGVGHGRVDQRQPLRD